jgi:hypothetical protein
MATYSATQLTKPANFDDGKRRKAAEMAATKILRCYPDYGKAPPEYVASLMAALDRYPIDIIAKLTDLQTGLPGKCRFLPVPADVVDMAEKLEAEMKAERQRPALPDYSHLHPISMEEYARVRAMPTSDSAQRKAAVIAALGYDPSLKRGVWKETSEEERPLKYVDKELLFKCHEEAMEELRAKRASAA